MKFYEYNHTGKFPLINEVVSPCDVITDDPTIFLIYAPNYEVAKSVADAHIFGGIPLTSFYGIFKSEKYNGEILCAM